ncbi:MAG: DUF1826 domain-containing protein [Oceanococcaceae bacterium]
MSGMPQQKEAALFPQFRLGYGPLVLADIYQPEVNLAVYRAAQHPKLEAKALELCMARPGLKLACSGNAAALSQHIEERLQAELGLRALVEGIRESIQLFDELFEPAAVGLRLEVLDRAMCPRCHVDRLAVRLIRTFCGPGTQWLPNEAVDRQWLGAAAAGLQDPDAALVQDPSAVQTLLKGDVALMKGEGWEGNAGRGLVHRSPQVAAGERRLVLTLDMAA